MAKTKKYFFSLAWASADERSKKTIKTIERMEAAGFFAVWPVEKDAKVQWDAGSFCKSDPEIFKTFEWSSKFPELPGFFFARTFLEPIMTTSA